MTDSVEPAGKETLETSASTSRRCILVLGMHRSGTSATARVLNLLGAALPCNILGANRSNQTGHWEPKRLVTLHDRMLAELGSRWDDWRKLNFDLMADSQKTAIREEIARLIEAEYKAAPLIVLKDPRICRFVPFYTELLAELGIEPCYVMPFRNPLAVAASLKARDGMTEKFASLLWLRHVLDAEAATRGHPRTFFPYESLLDDWRSVVQTIALRVGFTWPRPFSEAAIEISAFLSPSHQHHAPTRHEFATHAEIPDWVKDTYESLLRLEQDSGSTAVLAELDRIRAEFDAACQVLGDATFAELSEREARFRAIERDLASQLSEKNQLLDELKSSLSWRITLPLRDLYTKCARLSKSPFAVKLSAAIHHPMTSRKRKQYRHRLRDEQASPPAIVISTSARTPTSSLQKFQNAIAFLSKSRFGTKLGPALRHPTSSRKRKIFRDRHTRQFSTLPPEPNVNNSKLLLRFYALMRHPFSSQSRKQYRRTAAGAVQGTYKIPNSVIEAQRRSISAYSIARARANQNWSHVRIALYTAISSNYDSLKVPRFLEPRYDYFLFSDSLVPDIGVYKIRPITYINEDPVRTARFVKTHPHHLLPDYQIAIWIDANITILGDIYPLVEAFLASGNPIAAIPHPERCSVYEEMEACIRRGKDHEDVIQEQISYLRRVGFEHDDLIETNFMMFDLRNKCTRRFLDLWWAQIDRYSRRDQLSVNYALQQAGITWHRITEQPTNVRNHPLFGFCPNHGHANPDSVLASALAHRTINPYAGLRYSLVRDERIAAQRNRRTDVVICVHNALEHVKLCLESIRRNRTSCQQRLIIIDDGSDQPTQQYLENFARGVEWIDLYRNDTRRGYTKAANQGLAASTGEFVILLNSDTIVTNGWAEKLADAAFSLPGVGIVGPLSNAASHQSIPEHRSSLNQTAINELPPGYSADDMNRLCEKWTVVDVLPRVPLVHGFCFGITREAIDKVGYFDEQNFPNGYGEENDYCFRASDAGIGLVIATHTFVFHAKSKSYADTDRVAFMKAGSNALKRLHGTRRVERAVRSMERNPLLQTFRQKSRALWSTSPILANLTDAHVGR